MVQIECAGVLFDNDGVLVDSHEQVVEAWTELASEFDLDIAVLLKELVGVRASDTLGRHLSPSRTDVAVARLEELEIALASSTKALAGSIELLDALPTGSWTIVTSASRKLAMARWKGAGIPVPDQVVTADDVSHGKPHPDPFIKGAACLGIAPSSCVAFEDSSAGGAAAKSAGATIIAVGDQPWSDEPWTRVKDLTSITVAQDNGLQLRIG